MPRDVRVGDVMRRDCVRVDGHQSLRRFVEDTLLRTGERCFYVQDDGHVAGLILPEKSKTSNPAAGTA